MPVANHKPINIKKTIEKPLPPPKFEGINFLNLSLLFFIISNFGVWTSSSFYSKDIFGLIACYVAAIPFYYGTLSGTIFYSFFLFGSYEFLSRKLSKVTSN